MNLYNLLKGEISQKELLNYWNATIKYKHLPNYIRGFVFNYKGSYVIVINKWLSYYKRKKTILHELAHIEFSHLEQCDKDLLALKVDSYEDEADRYIKYLEESL